MNHLNKFAVSVTAAAALVLTAFAAHAQLAPPAPKAQPAPPAAKAPAAPPAATAPAKTAAKKPAAPQSACNKLDEKGCSANTDCSWIAATKRKDGKEVAAYCRSKPKSTRAAPKKADAKAPAAKAAAPATPATPAAPGAKAPPAKAPAAATK